MFAAPEQPVILVQVGEVFHSIDKLELLGRSEVAFGVKHLQLAKIETEVPLLLIGDWLVME